VIKIWEKGNYEKLKSEYNHH